VRSPAANRASQQIEASSLRHDLEPLTQPLSAQIEESRKTAPSCARVSFNTSDRPLVTIRQGSWKFSSRVVG